MLGYTRCCEQSTNAHAAHVYQLRAHISSGHPANRLGKPADWGLDAVLLAIIGLTSAMLQPHASAKSFSLFGMN